MKKSTNLTAIAIHFALTFVVTALFMTIFEALKSVFLGPGLTLWQSHIITIFGASVIAAIIAVMIRIYANRYQETNEKLKEMLKLSESILFNSPLPMSVYTESGQCIEVNEAYAQIFNATRSAMQGYHNFSAFEACGLLSKIKIALKDNAPQRYEVHDTNLFGREVWFDCEILPLAIKSKPHVLIQFYDFTQRKRAEEKLQAMNNELHMAMKHLVQAEKMAALGTLVAGVAHELNTPIGNALMASTTLSKHVHDLDETMQKGSLKKSTLETYIVEAKDESDLIERNIARAGNLVRSFKQVAVDQSSECRRKFDLKQVIEQVTITMRPILDKSVHKLKVEVEDGIQMDGFPGSIEQVITSFINNALFHAFPNIDSGQMTLQGKLVDDQVVLEFFDNGVGMSEGVAAHAFDPFFSTRMGMGGSGLGLYIVNSIVTGILGGNIELITAEGQGSRFRLNVTDCFAGTCARINCGTVKENLLCGINVFNSICSILETFLELLNWSFYEEIICRHGNRIVCGFNAKRICATN